MMFGDFFVLKLSAAYQLDTGDGSRERGAQMHYTTLSSLQLYSPSCLHNPISLAPVCVNTSASL